MLKKIRNHLYIVLFLALSLSGCSAIKDIGKALTSGFKGFSIHFP